MNAKSVVEAVTQLIEQDEPSPADIDYGGPQFKDADFEFPPLRRLEPGPELTGGDTVYNVILDNPDTARLVAEFDSVKSCLRPYVGRFKLFFYPEERHGMIEVRTRDEEVHAGLMNCIESEGIEWYEAEEILAVEFDATQFADHYEIAFESVQEQDEPSPADMDFGLPAAEPTPRDPRADIMQQEEEYQKKVIAQFVAVQRSGLTNMFTSEEVQYIAYSEEFAELGNAVQDGMYTSILRNYSELTSKISPEDIPALDVGDDEELGEQEEPRSVDMDFGEDPPEPSIRFRTWGDLMDEPIEGWMTDPGPDATAQEWISELSASKGPGWAPNIEPDPRYPGHAFDNWRIVGVSPTEPGDEEGFVIEIEDEGNVGYYAIYSSLPPGLADADYSSWLKHRWVDGREVAEPQVAEPGMVNATPTRRPEPRPDRDPQVGDPLLVRRPYEGHDFATIETIERVGDKFKITFLYHGSPERDRVTVTVKARYVGWEWPAQEEEEDFDFPGWWTIYLGHGLSVVQQDVGDMDFGEEPVGEGKSDPEVSLRKYVSQAKKGSAGAGQRLIQAADAIAREQRQATGEAELEQEVDKLLEQEEPQAGDIDYGKEPARDYREISPETHPWPEGSPKRWYGVLNTPGMFDPVITRKSMMLPTDDPLAAGVVLADACYYNVAMARRNLEGWRGGEWLPPTMDSFYGPDFPNGQPETEGTGVAAVGEEWNGGFGASREEAERMFVRSEPGGEGDWEEESMTEQDEPQAGDIDYGEPEQPGPTVGDRVEHMDIIVDIHDRREFDLILSKYLSTHDPFGDLSVKDAVDSLPSQERVLLLTDLLALHYSEPVFGVRPTEEESKLLEQDEPQAGDIDYGKDLPPQLFWQIVDASREAKSWRGQIPLANVTEFHNQFMKLRRKLQRSIENVEEEEGEEVGLGDDGLDFALTGTVWSGQREYERGLQDFEYWRDQAQSLVWEDNDLGEPPVSRSEYEEEFMTEQDEPQASDIDYGAGSDPSVVEVYREGFREGNGAIDYAIRNCTIGDEEEIRIIEDYEDFSREEWRNKWRPQLTEDEIDKLEQLIVAARGDMVLDCDAVLAILTPHVSNPELFQSDYTLWEILFWGSD